MAHIFPLRQDTTTSEEGSSTPRLLGVGAVGIQVGLLSSLIQSSPGLAGALLICEAFQTWIDFFLLHTVHLYSFSQQNFSSHHLCSLTSLSSIPDSIQALLFIMLQRPPQSRSLLTTMLPDSKHYS